MEQRVSEAGDVLAVVREMNRCWTCNSDQELERLRDHFHKTMVAITPVDRLRIEGRESCFACWSGFAQSVTVHFWKEKDPIIHIYDRTAIVTYYFEMAYDQGGQRIEASGRDMLVLIKENGRWQVVADQFSPFPF